MDTQEYVSPSVDLEPEEVKSAFDRFAEVFTAPVEAFSGLTQTRRAPIILWGLVITVVASMFSAILFSTNDDLRTVTRDKQIEQLDKMRDDGKIDDKQYEQQLEAMDMMMSGTVFMIVGAISAAIGSVIFAMIIGAIVLILIRVLQRDRESVVGFGVALAATLIAFMILNLESILTSIGMMITSDMEFRISPVLLGVPENPYLKFFLNLLNPFTIWLWFALGTGIALLARSERAKAIAAIAGVWIVGGLVMTAIGTLFTSLTIGG